MAEDIPAERRSEQHEMRLAVALVVVALTVTIALSLVAALRLAAPIVVMYYENQALQNTVRHNENLRFNCNGA